MTTRLHLLCSASTTSVSSIAFAADEPLDPRGRESLLRLCGRLPRCDIALRSPALCAAQTAEGLGLDARAEVSLRDCDFGCWAGRTLADIHEQSPEAVAQWLQNPRAVPHGGEMTRVREWMDGLLAGQRSVLAITHATVIRAAIAHAVGAGAEAFRHIDVAPLTRTKLSRGGARWTLAALVPLKDE